MVNFDEFKIGSLFEKCSLKRIKKNFNKKKDLSEVCSAEYNLPLINAKFGNNGIMYYGRSTDWESEKMTIGIINDGAIAAGLVYAHPEKTGTLYNAYQIKLKNEPKNFSPEMLLYLSACLQKSIRTKFSYERKATWDRVKNESIKLPTQNHKIDFEFMEQYVQRIMEQYVQRIMEQYVQRIEAYLKTLGYTSMEDVQLTNEEKKLLNKNTDVIFKPFKLGKSYILRKKIYTVSDIGLFDIKPTKKKINANTVRFGEGRPYVARGEGNNGIHGLIKFEEQYLNPANTISFGQDTATMYYQEQKYFTSDKILILELNSKYGKLDKKIALYLINAMKKTFALYGWGQSSYAIDSISFLDVYLPVKKNNEPDFEYMEKYITAIEKKVVQKLYDEQTSKIKLYNKLIK